MEYAAHDVMMMDRWLGLGWPILAEVLLFLSIFTISIIVLGWILPDVQLLVPTHSQELRCLYFLTLWIEDANE